MPDWRHRRVVGHAKRGAERLVCRIQDSASLECPDSKVLPSKPTLPWIVSSIQHCPWRLLFGTAKRISSPKRTLPFSSLGVETRSPMALVSHTLQLLHCPGHCNEPTQHQAWMEQEWDKSGTWDMFSRVFRAFWQWQTLLSRFCLRSSNQIRSRLNPALCSSLSPPPPPRSPLLRMHTWTACWSCSFENFDYAFRFKRTDAVPI